MTVLGMEEAVKGENPNALTIGDCISKAARFQRASLGIIKLDMMPTLTAVWF